MQHTTEFNLPKLSAWYKKKYLAYATQVLAAQQQMTTHAGQTILHYTLQKTAKHKKMEHYPDNDRIDSNTGAQYFYHCHRENYELMEHGHFHCFLRYKKIPTRIKPSPLTDWDKYIDNPMTHLIAISMNQLGMPIRLFTVNRWVSNEIWYDATNAPNLLKLFKMTKATDAYWHVLDQWVEGMLHLFYPQIIWLLQERDKAIRNYQLSNLSINIYADEQLEELSSLNIDLKKQIEWILTQ